MTLSQVARTGRLFRRTSNSVAWYWLDAKEILYCAGHPRAGLPVYKATIDAEMLVATDWEAEPLKLELTAEDVMRAARQLDDIASKRRLSAAEFGKLICKELGLIEEGAG